MYIYIYIYMYICIYIYICMYVWMDGCMHACMHACIHIYIYIYIYIAYTNGLWYVMTLVLLRLVIGSKTWQSVVLSCRQVGITPKIPWFRWLSPRNPTWLTRNDWSMIGMFEINIFPGSGLRDIPSSWIVCLLEIACIRLKRARSRIHVVSARKLFAPCLQVTPVKGLGTLNFRVKLFQSPLVLVNKQSSTSYNML